MSSLMPSYWPVTFLEFILKIKSLWDYSDVSLSIRVYLIIHQGSESVFKVSTQSILGVNSVKIRRAKMQVVLWMYSHTSSIQNGVAPVGDQFNGLTWCADVMHLLEQSSMNNALASTLWHHTLLYVSMTWWWFHQHYRLMMILQHLEVT